MSTASVQPAIEYPDSDGQPMADNTLQYEWIVTIKGNLGRMLPDFVAGALLWYPVEGDPKTRIASDVLVALGRPKGHRGSYKQWEEASVAPQVVWEISSPGNRPGEMTKKRQFYERFGVQEYYVYDPDHERLEGWLRQDNHLIPIDEMNGFVSPRLDVRFELTDTLHLYKPSGDVFLSFDALDEDRLQARAKADAANERIASLATENRTLATGNQTLVTENRTLAAEKQALATGNQTLVTENRTLAAEKQALAAEIQALRNKLRALGIDPDA